MNANLSTLLNMLAYCRPRGSQTETEFIDRYIRPLPSASQDGWGNWHVKVGESRTLFSCHTDTVAITDGRQTLHYDPTTGLAQLSKRSRQRSRCLGADDTIGVFLMCQMIARRIPGHYVFHYGEESGGIGSSALVAGVEPLWLQSFDRIIAFDRKGTSDVITWQGYGQCCSDTFARALASALNTAEPTCQYAPSDRGVYTDSAEYVSVIGECTNISVGYYHEHTRREYVDTAHVLRLLKALVRVDWEALPCERKPGDDDSGYLSHWRNWSHTRSATVVDAQDYIIAGTTTEECLGCGVLCDMIELDRDGLCKDCARACGQDAYAYLDPEYARVQAALALQQCQQDLTQRRAKPQLVARCHGCRMLAPVNASRLCQVCDDALERSEYGS